MLYSKMGYLEIFQYSIVQKVPLGTLIPRYSPTFLPQKPFPYWGALTELFAVFMIKRAHYPQSSKLSHSIQLFSKFFNLTVWR